ncbi:alpha/beta fold hydrolase [Streptomyces sp. NPDC087440]|uniref:alpha/beta fold hydrolase n=1 Tax=Streptomyces sp. NPDC087440 TaxID=3365790 RepID=UPI00381057BF
MAADEQEQMDLSYPPDARRAQVREGVELYYESVGSGTPITFLNNFFLSAPFWRSITGELAEHHRVVTYDLANHGASGKLAKEPSWQEHAADLIGLLDALEIESTYLVGTSASTQLARDVALAHPDRVRGLILAGPVFGLTGMRRHRQLNRAWRVTLQTQGIAGLYNHMYPEVIAGEMNEEGGTPGFLGLRESFMAMNTPEELANGLSLVQEGDPSSQLLTRIGAPTLVVLGDDDILLSPGRGRQVAALFPRGRCEIMPNAGHVPFFDDPESFQSMILKFVAETEAHA